MASNSKSILIVGSGAVGRSLAYRLSKESAALVNANKPIYKITLLGRNQTIANKVRIQTHFSSTKTNDLSEEITYKTLETLGKGEENESYDYVLFGTKNYQLKQASEELCNKLSQLKTKPGAYYHFISLANGLNGKNQLWEGVMMSKVREESFLQKNVIHCHEGLCYLGANITNERGGTGGGDGGNDNKILHVTSTSADYLKFDRIVLENLPALQNDLQVFSPYFQFVNDIKGEIFTKLLANAIINPLTAILKCKNGELKNHPECMILIEGLLEEILSIAQQENVRLTTMNNNPKQHVLNVIEGTKYNTSSMLNDLLTNKRTEIDSLNGALLRLKKTKYNEMIYYLIKTMEKTAPRISN